MCDGDSFFKKKKVYQITSPSVCIDLPARHHRYINASLLWNDVDACYYRLFIYNVFVSTSFFSLVLTPHNTPNVHWIMVKKKCRKSLQSVGICMSLHGLLFWKWQKIKLITFIPVEWWRSIERITTENLSDFIRIISNRISISFCFHFEVN